MSTFVQLIVAVTTGDDLALDAMKRGDTLTLEFYNGDKDDSVKATLHSFAYIPEEALE